MTLAALREGAPYDLVVIGGGINGCGIAREAARRGLRVALLEASDFGFGTTWRSTKLIHGGLRYLEHGDVRLVFESLRERTWLLRTRPHLVSPQRFVLPMLPWTRRPAWQLRMGLAMYDLMAMNGGVPRHSRLSDSALHELAPFLPDETSGGLTFYDARVRAPERLALEMALEAEAHGAVIANHTPVVQVLAQGRHVSGVVVQHGDETAELLASAVVNAAGPWVDAVNAAAPGHTPELLGVTRGAHITLELDGPLPTDAIFSTARSDGRVFFAVPQEGLLLVGTTDHRYDGDPSDIRPTADEVAYLLEEARIVLPGMDLRADQVRYAYAGLRPLQKVSGGPEAAISRRHALIDHGSDGGPDGLYSVVGGKLSTFRPLANDVMRRLGTGGETPPEASIVPRQELPWLQALRESSLGTPVRRHLRTYGPAVPEILELGTTVICEDAHATVGEVRYAARNEHVQTLADLLLRRTGIGWAACRGMCCRREVARIAAPILGWDAAEIDRQVKAFDAEAEYHLPVPSELARREESHATV